MTLTSENTHTVPMSLTSNTEDCMAAHLRLRTDEFENYCRLAQARTIEAKAELLKVNGTTVSRILKGERRPGIDFLAAVLDAFTREPFEVPFERVLRDLFELESDDERPAA